VTPTSTVQSITVVNSRLKPWTADNFDLSLESYMFKNGFGSIGVFQKDISNFFVVTSQEGTPEMLALYGVFPAAGDLLDYVINTRGNGGDATVKGLEFSYRQNLTFLPDWARGVQVFANYTRSRLGGENAADFTGFNPETLSWGVTLTRPRYAIKFTSTEQDETRRNALATSTLNPPGTYQWQGELKRYVLSAEFSVTRNVSLYGSLSDFNEPDGLLDVQKVYAEGTPPNLRNQRVATRGQALVLGIKGSF
jgi:iron complex outermembrane receptor protein